MFVLVEIEGTNTSNVNTGATYLSLIFIKTENPFKYQYVEV